MQLLNTWRALLRARSRASRALRAPRVGEAGWAVAIAIVFNYALNNLITYRDRSLKGWKWVTGLLSFAAVCALGAFADIGISSYIYNESAADGLLRNVWVIPASIGIIVGAVWNYAVSSVYTWRSSK